MAGEDEYGDRTILALKEKYRERQQEQQPVSREILIGGNMVPLYREELFGGKCSMLLPATLADMDRRECIMKYRSRNRPQVIKTDSNGDATMTLRFLSIPAGEEETDIRKRMGSIRADMARVWKQNVFYDTGEAEAEGITVAWMDFRAYCLDGSLYGLLFLFRTGEGEVLGNFHCSFPLYDIWKQPVLKLLETVKTDRQGKEI